MTYIAKARELGLCLAETSEVKALVEAEKQIMANEEARLLFLEYREKEKVVITSQMLSKIVPEKDAIALLELKTRLSSRNQLIKTYFLAIQRYERIMAMVNLTITTAISGTPSIDDLPIPDKLKGLASQLLNTIGGHTP